ncbi:MAG: AI-2E family transporter [Proteobacteria bacterium]|nr:AI-2E family transporter [Pseudomonadota bacterium]
MIPPDDHSSAHSESAGLLVLLIVVSLTFGWILLPFYGTVLWGSIIALTFAPLYRTLLAHLNGRRTPAALLTLMIVALIVVIPFALITASLAREATLLYQRMQSGEVNPAIYFRGVFDALPQWVLGLIERFGLADFDSLQRRLAIAVAQGMQFIATHALSIGQNTFAFVASLFITLYLAFFFIRDGDGIARAVQQAIPLAAEHKLELLSKFTTVIRATVKGNLLVAAVQGALGGIAFWFLGINAALLWAVLMGFLSLLPAVGAALVWLPVAIYLLVTGAVWHGIALTAYGVLVIGLTDNLLRPLLVGKDTRLPDYVVMMTTLGGMAVFGINGFILGPAIAAMFIAVWHIYGTKRGTAMP